MNILEEAVRNFLCHAVNDFLRQRHNCNEVCVGSHDVIMMMKENLCPEGGVQNAT